MDDDQVLSNADQLVAPPEVVWAGVPGSKREGDDDPSQDAIAVARAGDSVIAVIADGAGSQFASGYGARLAVHGALESLKEGLEGAVRKPTIETALQGAVRDARQALITVAAASDYQGRELHLKNLATTISACVVSPEWVGIGSVGDGIHVLRDFGGELRLTAMAPDTDIANQTDFITSADALDKLVVEVHEAESVESVFLSTDGLDAQLLGRRDGERWALATVNSLIDAPVLEGWQGAEFERFLKGQVVRDRTRDDCSLILIRRVPPAADSQAVDGLELSFFAELSDGRHAWLVRGCADLLAVELPAAVPPDAAIAGRGTQVWDRTRRFPPVHWPVRRIGENLVLVPRVLAGARSVGGVLNKRRSGSREGVMTGIRECVEALHAAGVAHGELRARCFALQGDETVTLWDPGPGMFEGGDREVYVQRDLEFLVRMEDGLADEPDRDDESHSDGRRRGRRRLSLFGRGE